MTRMQRPAVVSSRISALSWAPHHFSQAPLVPTSKAAAGALSLLAVGSTGCPGSPRIQPRAWRRVGTGKCGGMEERMDGLGVCYIA